VKRFSKGDRTLTIILFVTAVKALVFFGFNLDFEAFAASVHCLLKDSSEPLNRHINQNTSSLVNLKNYEPDYG